MYRWLGICKILLMLLFMLFNSGILLEVSYAKNSINKIVASVGGEPITYYDVLVAMHSQLREANLDTNNPEDAVRIARLQETVLNDLINNILIEQEAMRYKVTITEQDIDNEMRKIARENKTSVDVLEQQIRLQGSNVELFKKNMRDNLLRQRIIGSFVFRKIVVTTQEIQEYYTKNIDTFKTDATFSLSYIKLATEEEAKSLLEKIHSGGTPFASAMEEYSLDSDSDGALGDFTFSELAPAWQHLLSSANAGNTVGPMAVDKQYLLLHVDKKKEGKALPLEDVYTTIENKIRDGRFSSQYASFVEGLRKKVDIRIYN